MKPIPQCLALEMLDFVKSIAQIDAPDTEWSGEIDGLETVLDSLSEFDEVIEVAKGLVRRVNEARAMS
jgi:hypothetical protein